MATMDDKALFVDTNVLVYANVIETPFHEQALTAINHRPSGQPDNMDQSPGHP